MLILTRHIGERISIGDDVWVTVLGQRHGCVSLGISAPEHVAIHREEIYYKVKQENQKVSSSVRNIENMRESLSLFNDRTSHPGVR